MQLDFDDRKTERKVLSACVKRKAVDVSARPLKMINSKLTVLSEETLEPADLKCARQALYRESQKKYPRLPHSWEETICMYALLAIGSTLTNRKCMCA